MYFGKGKGDIEKTCLETYVKKMLQASSVVTTAITLEFQREAVVGFLSIPISHIAFESIPFSSVLSGFYSLYNRLYLYNENHSI